MKKTYYIFFSLVLVLVLVGCTKPADNFTNSPAPVSNENNQVLTNENQVANDNQNQPSDIGTQNSNIQLPGTKPEPEVGTPALYTLAQIATHSSKADCWLVADAKVYNVTSFIDKHPGGEKILLGCGKDMTEFFNTKHLKQSKEKLPEFYIGDLKQ